MPSTKLPVIVSDEECWAEKSLARWRICAVVLMGICCVAAIVSVGIALFCFGREQATRVQLVELSNELHQIKVQTEALQSRCGSVGLMASASDGKRETDEVLYDYVNIMNLNIRLYT